MLKIYIIGSDIFTVLKREIFDVLKNLSGVTVHCVGFSPIFNRAINEKNFELLHTLEDISIEEANLIILVDKGSVFGRQHIGADTQRELDFAKSLKKVIWTSDILFENFLKIKGQQ